MIIVNEKYGLEIEIEKIKLVDLKNRLYLQIKIKYVKYNLYRYHPNEKTIRKIVVNKFKEITPNFTFEKIGPNIIGFYFKDQNDYVKIVLSI